MEKTTEPTSKAKFLLCDLPNTLFDSRHRAIPEIDSTYIAGIENDKLNYAAYSLLKDFHKLGYNIIYSHYCLNRIKSKVIDLMNKHKLPTSNLYTNFVSQQVNSNASLKQYLYEEYYDFDLVIDNDPSMRPYWLTKGVALINVPLTIEYFS